MPADRRQRFLRGAEDEMIKQADEYDQAKPGLGDEFLSAVERAVELILDGPQRWQKIDGWHHRYVLKRFPYSILYRFDETEVIVVAVAHHKRRPDYWRHRR